MNKRSKKELYALHDDDQTYDRKGVDYIMHMLKMEDRELSRIEKEVLHSIAEQELISKELNTEDRKILSFGDRVADAVASFGGSWLFIGSFFFLLLAWIVLNVLLKSDVVFDPYPFILLNLILSCIAAIQAPVIMMSQNRKEARDRQRAENDYKVNLKAELEIRLLHEKMDYLITKQWRRLIEIQKIQMEMFMKTNKE